MNTRVQDHGDLESAQAERVTPLQDLRVSIFADGADLDGMLAMKANPLIRGFTTNPTLMRKAGVSNYRAFGQAVLAAIPDRPINFEVLADDFETMHRQALDLRDWGANVYVKIPITNTRGDSSEALLRLLAREGVHVNVTAITTLDQVALAAEAVSAGPGSVISVFAGRIADTGRDPVPVMRRAVEILAQYKNLELLWASPREVLNIFQADEVGCHIVTVSMDILKKLDVIGKDLTEFSLETVQMFVRDAIQAGLEL